MESTAEVSTNDVLYSKNVTYHMLVAMIETDDVETLHLKKSDGTIEVCDLCDNHVAISLQVRMKKSIRKGDEDDIIGWRPYDGNGQPVFGQNEVSHIATLGNDTYGSDSVSGKHDETAVGYVPDTGYAKEPELVKVKLEGEKSGNQVCGAGVHAKQDREGKDEAECPQWVAKKKNSVELDSVGGGVQANQEGEKKRVHSPYTVPNRPKWVSKKKEVVELDIISNKKVQVAVSNGFLNQETNMISHLVVFCGGMGREAWLLKPDFINSTLPLIADDAEVKREDWMTSFELFKQRDEEYSVSSLFKRQKRSSRYSSEKGRVVELLCFTMNVHILHQHLTARKIKSAVDLFFKFFKPEVNIGELIIDHIKEHESGIFTFLTTKRYVGKDERTIKRLVNEALVATFREPPFISFQHCLDQFLVDYDIKLILQSVGVKNLNDADEKVKRFAYKNYPRRVLPDWNTLVQELAY